MLAALATRRKTHPTYAADATSEERENVRIWLRKQLIAVGKHYQSRNLNEAEHLEQIRRFAADVTMIHGHLLHGGKFRFGVAQKLMNLYLKYLWSAGVVKLLHHCPLDGLIASESGIGYEWTTSDSESAYTGAISKLRAYVGGEPLPTWEVRIFQVKRGAA